VTQRATDFDNPWKATLEEYFESFVAFFFPSACAGIDWTRSCEFLEKELQQVTRDANLGRRLADKLVKVWLRSGDEVWVLVHVEIVRRESRASGAIAPSGLRLPASRDSLLPVPP